MTQTIERTAGGLVADLVWAAAAGNWPALAVACRECLDLGLTRADVGEGALAYAVADVLDCAEHEDWAGFADAVEVLAEVGG